MKVVIRTVADTFDTELTEDELGILNERIDEPGVRWLEFKLDDAHGRRMIRVAKPHIVSYSWRLR